MARPYTLFKRPTRKAKTFIYYVQFRDEEGKRTTAMTTGQTTKSAAETWVQEYLKKEGRTKFRDTFGRYAEKWWIWENCPYIQGELARGKKLTRSYADVRRSYLDGYILPVFSEKKLSKITPGMIEKWLHKLRDTKSRKGTLLSPSTVNHILTTLKIMISEAFRLGLINHNPVTVIKPLYETRKEKSILTIEEVRELFREDQISSVWDNQVNHFTLNLLAASTGLRMGEIQAIQIQHVYENHIDILHSWERKYGLKETKTRKNRIVPIPHKTSFFLQKIISESPYKNPDDLVFYSRDGKNPVYHRNISLVLYKAFKKIGITPEEREKRNVSFHSWRHFFNSVCRASGVPDSKLQSVTGHKTQEMTEHYTHFNLDDFQEVVEVQEEVFRGE